MNYITTAHEQISANQADRCREVIEDLDEAIAFGNRLKLLRTQDGIPGKGLRDPCSSLQYFYHPGKRTGKGG